MGNQRSTTGIISPASRKQGFVIGIEKDPLIYAEIIQSSDDVIEGLTLDGKVAVWNRGAEELYGFNLTEIFGKSVITIYWLMLNKFV